MQTPDELIQSFESIIQKIKYMTLATCDKEGQPWNTHKFSRVTTKANI